MVWVRAPPEEKTLLLLLSHRFNSKSDNGALLYESNFVHKVDVLGSIYVIMIPRMTIQRVHCLLHYNSFVLMHIFVAFSI